MKNVFLASLAAISLSLAPASHAQTTYNLTPLATFGLYANGSILPGDYNWILAGNNQRGLAFDPITGELIFVDTESGSGGSSFVQGQIVTIDGTYGTNIAGLNLTGIAGGSYADSPVAVDDDGAVYVANQVTDSSISPVIVYRWDSVNSTSPPVVVFSNNIVPAQRYGVSIDIRGAGTNTQIILGSSQLSGGTGTNVVIFTTADGTNLTSNVLGTDATAANFSDGVAFGLGNTFWAKNVGGAPLRWLSFDLTNGTATTLRSFSSSTLPASDNLGPIAVDNVQHLLAAIDVLPNTVGPKFVRLYDISDTTQPPVLLDIQPFPTQSVAGTAPPGNLDFGGGNLYAHIMNGGIVAYSVNQNLAGTPPVVISQPQATNIVAAGQNFTLTVLAYPAAHYQWFTNNVAISGATNGNYTLSPVQTNSSALYSVVITNSAGQTNITSQLVAVDPTSLYHLNLLWQAGAGDGKAFLNGTGGSSTPNQRGIAYNALSNELYVVSRGAATGAASSNYVVYVLNATNGVVKSQLNTNGIPNFVISDVPGNNGIALVSIAVADDGAIYAANEAPDSIGGVTQDPTKQFKIFRWANSDSNTLPTLVYQGEPSEDTVSNRWGDVIRVRGSGPNTQILLDVNNSTAGGTYRKAALLTPTDAGLTNFTAQWFFVANSATTIGRSLQFDGINNNLFQKRKGGSLIKSSFDPNNPLGGRQIYSTTLITYTNFPATVEGVELDLTRNLAVGVVQPTSTTVPDSLALFDITSPNNPLLVGQYNFSQNPRNANANFISQTIIAGDLVFALDGNNGIGVFRLATGPLNPPYFTTQPQNQRVIFGGTAKLTAGTLEYATLQWQTNGVNISGATNSALTITNAQFTDAANYRAVANYVFSGSATSLVATVTVVSPADEFSLKKVWSASPGESYVSATGGSPTPNERSLAYNSLSNEVYVVKRNATNDFSIYVLDAASGAVLRTLNTNGINLGIPDLNGASGLTLASIAVADDGTIYAANETADAGGFNDPAGIFTVYRWSDSDAATLPVVVFQGDPANQLVSSRWGDTLAVRGSGINTEIILDNQQGTFGAILKPTDVTLTVFTNQFFATAVQGTTIGRSLQFGRTNTIWQRRAGAPASAFLLSSYDLAGQTSSQLASRANFPGTLGQVAYDSARGLLAGVNYTGSSTSPDKLVLFDVSDLGNPFLVGSYDFPTNHQANANYIGQVIFAGNRIFAIEGNNGISGLHHDLGPQLSISGVWQPKWYCHGQPTSTARS